MSGALTVDWFSTSFLNCILFYETNTVLYPTLHTIVKTAQYVCSECLEHIHIRCKACPNCKPAWLVCVVGIDLIYLLQNASYYVQYILRYAAYLVICTFVQIIFNWFSKKRRKQKLMIFWTCQLSSACPSCIITLLMLLHNDIHNIVDSLTRRQAWNGGELVSNSRGIEVNNRTFQSVVLQCNSWRRPSWPLLTNSPISNSYSCN